MYENRRKQKKEVVFHVRCSIHAKRPLLLISVIQFFSEPVDFLLAAIDTIDLYAAQDYRGNAAAEQQTDEKVQHSFITSLSSCDASERRNSSSVCSPPMKFGSVSSVKGIYPSAPKSSGSFVITLPP